MTLILISFICYLIFMLFVGIYTSRMNKNLGDFLLGGRRLGSWVISLSERASGESAWLLVGLTGTALLIGWAAIWTALGCVLGIIFYWIFVAKKLRQKSEEFNSLTIPDYFESRFNDKTHLIRIFSTIIIILSYSLYIAAQFKGAGTVLNVAFQIPYILGMVIGAIIIISYTMMGGFFAVAWTDFFQGIIMVFALVVLPIVGYIRLINAGDTSIFNNIPNIIHDKTGWEAFALIISGLAWGFGYMGQPHLLTRFMALDKVENIGKSRVIAITWAVLAYCGAILLGVIGIAALRETGGGTLPGIIFGERISHQEQLFAIMAKSLLSKGIWQILAGIMISGAIAAMMSTADSQLLVTTSALTEDIYRKITYENGRFEKWNWGAFFAGGFWYIAKGMVKKGFYLTGILAIYFLISTYFMEWHKSIGMTLAFLFGLLVYMSYCGYFSERDYYETFNKRNKKELTEEQLSKRLIVIGRVTTLIVGILAFIMAQTGESVFKTVLHAWSALGAAFGPLILISLWWKKVTRNAAIFGILSGFGLIILWNLPKIKEAVVGWTKITNDVIPAFFVSFLGIIIISIIEHKSKENAENKM